MLTLIDNHLVSYWSAIDDYLIAEGRKGVMGTIAKFVHFLSEETQYKKNPTHFMTRADGQGLGTSKKSRTINGTRFKFINKFKLPETFKMTDALQISDLCSSFTV